MKNTILAAVLTVLLLTACSELFLISITVPYPFDTEDLADTGDENGTGDADAETETDDGTYEIEVGEVVDTVDAILRSETQQAWDTLVSGLEEQQETLNAVEEEFCRQFPDVSECKAGGAPSLTVETTENSYLTFDNLMTMLNGDTVIKSVQVVYGTTSNEQQETLSVSFSICDMDFNEAYTTRDPWLTDFRIRNFKSYCVADPENRDSMPHPYFSIEYEAAPKQLLLSRDKDIKDYKGYLDKIYSASASTFSLIIEEMPEGLTLDEDSTDTAVSKVSVTTELYAQKVSTDTMYRFDTDADTWVECTELEAGNPDLGCAYRGIADDDGPVAERIGKIYNTVYNVDTECKRGDYWVGELKFNDEDEKQSMELLYTYDGQQVLQKAIKNLDMQLGMKSFFTIKPGSKSPDGVLKTSISAEFYFVVEPFK